MKKFYYSFIISLIFLFSGCTLVEEDGIARNLNSSMKPLMVNLTDLLYPLLGFIGVIMFGLGFHTLFIKKNRPDETIVNNLLAGTIELLIAIVLVASKKIAENF